MNHIERLSDLTTDESFRRFKDFLSVYTSLAIPQRVELFRQVPQTDLASIFQQAQAEKNNLMDLLFQLDSFLSFGVNCVKLAQADQENVNSFNSLRNMQVKEPQLNLKPIKGMSFGGKMNQP